MDRHCGGAEFDDGVSQKCSIDYRGRVGNVIRIPGFMSFTGFMAFKLLGRIVLRSR